MCIYTSLVERTPAAGRHANLSAGVASANAINCSETCRHSPSYPCQSPSGSAWANNVGALTETHNNNDIQNNETQNKVCADRLIMLQFLSADDSRPPHLLSLRR